MRRRRTRRRRVSAAGVVILVAIAVVATAVGFGVHHAVARHPVAVATAGTQHTVLLQVSGPGGVAAGSALLASDATTSRGLELLVPARLITGVCGYGNVPFGTVLAFPQGSVLARQTLSQLLGGVAIDGSWVLSGDELAALVNAVGGVTVDVDTTVTTGSAGHQVTALSAGSQHLNGAQASEYATYVASTSEGASGQELRLQQVVDAVVTQLPRSTALVSGIIARLGPGATSTLGADRLATLLVGLAAADRTAGGVTPTDLPVTAIDDGGAAPSYTVSNGALTPLVRSQLAQSLPAHQVSQPSVYLLNGTTRTGLVATTCPKLSAHGLAYAGSGAAATTNFAQSVVEIPSATQLPVADRVAAALGLPDGDIRQSPTGQNIADVVVVLGRDYRP